MMDLQGLLDGAGSYAFVLLDLMVKGTAVLVVGGTAAVLARRATAATRHLLWTSTLLALLALPVLSVILPAWGVLPGWAARPEGRAQDRAALRVAGPLVKELDGPRLAGPSREGVPPLADHVASLPVINQHVSRIVVSPGSWLVILYAVGAVVTLVPLLLSPVFLRRLQRSSVPLSGPPWPGVLREVCGALGVRRAVALLQSPGRVIPLTFGLLYPKIVLPADAGAWSGERRRMVLLHEVAHIQRHDCLISLFTRLACALFWFHPLVWWASSRVCLEREHACDDLVLSRGVVPAAYASELFTLATTLSAHGSYAALSMARRSSLEGRIRAILDPSRNRRHLPLAIAILIVLIVTGIIIPLSMVRGQATAGTNPGTQPAGAPTTAAVLRGSADTGEREPVTGQVQKLGAEEAKAFDAIVDLGGKVTIDVRDGVARTTAVDFRVLKVAESGLAINVSRVTDSDLKWLESTPHLEKLVLAGPKVTDAGLVHLKGLPELWELELHGRQITDAGMANLTGLGQLQKLSLFGTSVGGVGLEHLKGLARLQSLSLVSAPLNDAGVEHLKGLTQLQELDLAGTAVTDAGLEQLAGLGQLQSLSLMDTSVSDAGLRHLQGWSKLRSLDLRSTLISEEAVRKLQAALPECKIVAADPSGKAGGPVDKGGSQTATAPAMALALAQERVVAEILKLGGEVREHGDGQVIEVDFNGKGVTNDVMTRLKMLTQLQTLNLSETKVTDVDLENVGELKSLQALRLLVTDVSDVGLEHLKGMTQLQTLVLAGTKVTDRGMEHLKGLKQLKELDLHATMVTDAGLEQIKGLSKLQWLGLGYTKVTDAGLEQLKGMTELGSLSLIGTAVTDAGLGQLKGLSKLQMLDVQQTRVSEEGAAKLRAVLPRCQIVREESK